MGMGMYVCMYVYMYEIEDPGQSGGPVSPAALGRSPQAVLTDSPLRLRVQVCMYDVCMYVCMQPTERSCRRSRLAARTCI